MSWSGTTRPTWFLKPLGKDAGGVCGGPARAQFAVALRDNAGVAVGLAAGAGADVNDHLAPGLRRLVRDELARAVREPPLGAAGVDAERPQEVASAAAAAVGAGRPGPAVHGQVTVGGTC